jgi:thiol-disulfide isomerase/thioredoxin
MLRLLFLLLSLSGPVAPDPAFPTWYNDLGAARQVAQREHKHILLNFSGSDWCGPCIQLRKEVFDDPVFSGMADSSLVLVNADFPRLKKNQLSNAQQQLNDGMADRYNPKGLFPLTLLLDVEGRVLMQWEGNPGIKAGEFSRRVRNIIEANH